MQPKTERKKRETQNQLENKVLNGNKYISINNHLKCQWTECSNQKTQSGRLDKKAKTFTLLPARDLPYGKGHIQIESFCPLIQSATLCLLIGAFHPLTFKVIIDRYVFIAILNLVFQLILCLSFLLFSFWLVSIYFMLEFFSFQFL